MAKHLMKYGEQEFSVNLDEDCIACELESNTVSLPQRTAREHVDYALDHPIGSPRLEEIVKPGQTVCIVAPDATRLWQSPHVYIPAVVERLNACGVLDAHIHILTATGSHRSMTREEHMAIVSEDIYKRIPVVDHVCTDSKNMVKAGVTSHGTEVWFNRLAMESDHIVLTGGVVYHFLAGYGGGPKYMLPGIASYETIQRHHNLALNKGFGSGSNPAVRSANLTRDNVFHTDLEEAALLGRPSFLLNVVVDEQYNIIKAVAGDMVKAHREACALVDAIDGVPVAGRTPLVIASAGGAPKDINFYQTIKTLANALAVVEEGGTIILLSACTEGFGSKDTEHQIRDFASMEAREKDLRAHFSIGSYVGFLFAESAEKYHLILVCAMPEEAFAKTGIHVTRTLDEALALARRLNNGNGRLRATLLPHGANTLPKLA
ncbi:nickel-dependent lactate racemase [uncultured Desulfovibrio sp.]|uniref:nickel-dependent lactate racemase n=1 Tax=Desulfovibrio legallii TaxID=571438 RepID=UPI001AA9A049|nr:nickel-dependent lactate racemase [uncultured Desulfovibrio sp.]CAI3237190.1 Transcriptional regulator [Desulfovibrio diazotrophicus]VVU42919.1 Transcriptional regulator [Desulfovibrio diazotrophicus]